MGIAIVLVLAWQVGLTIFLYERILPELRGLRYQVTILKTIPTINVEVVDLTDDDLADD